MRRDLYAEMFRQESFYWWHVGKRELVKELLKKYADLGQKPQKILDVGCGTGMLLKDLSTEGEVWGLDKDQLALNFCQKRGFKNLTKADLTKKLPYAERTFTVILALDVLEHLQNDHFALAEFSRLLQPGGFLVLTVPAYPQLWSRWDKVCGHQRRYSAQDLGGVVSQAGFRLRKLSYFNSFALLPAVLVRFIKSLFSRQNYHSDFFKLPSFLNQFLLFLTAGERKILLKTDLPAGLSLICLAQK